MKCRADQLGLSIASNGEFRYQFGSDRHGEGFGVYNYDMTERYYLSRVFEMKEKIKSVNFVMLNPSTANASKLDPTVTRCAEYSKKWGYEKMVVTNLFPIISTDPEKLKMESGDTATNNEVILDIAKSCDLVVCAWGQIGVSKEQGMQIYKDLCDQSIPLYALEIAKNGEPKHPLYLKGDLKPIRVY